MAAPFSCAEDGFAACLAESLWLSGQCGIFLRSGWARRLSLRAQPEQVGFGFPEGQSPSASQAAKPHLAPVTWKSNLDKYGMSSGQQPLGEKTGGQRPPLQRLLSL